MTPGRDFRSKFTFRSSSSNPTQFRSDGTWTQSWLHSQAQRDGQWDGQDRTGLWPCSQLLENAATEQVQEIPFSEGLPTELPQQNDAQCHVN